MYQPPKIKPLCPPEIPPRCEDIPYASVILDNGEDYELKMDIYQDSQQSQPGPCIIYIFGGGFLWGEYKQVTQKAVYCRDLVRLTKEGYTVVCPDYRRASQSIFPACIQDLKGLVRFLKAHGREFHIDPERLGVLGNSAGGHLAMMLALSADHLAIEGCVGGNLDQSSSVKTAVSFYGTADLWDVLRDSVRSDYLSAKDLVGTEIENVGNDQAPLIPAIIVGYTGQGRSITKLHQVLESGNSSNPDWTYIDLLKKCSPISYVHADCPPILLLHGSKDPIVNPNQSRKLYQSLVDAGADVTLVEYGQGGHGPSLGSEIDQFAYDFLKQNL